MIAWFASPACRRVASSRVMRPCLSIDTIWVLVPNARSADAGSRPALTCSRRKSASTRKFSSVVIFTKPNGVARHVALGAEVVAEVRGQRETAGAVNAAIELPDEHLRCAPSR
jgi:hypothetical protein